MSYYAIGIGGTGAKCVEALAHLCASGLGGGKDLFVMFVDPDRANGSLERATITLEQYRAAAEARGPAKGVFPANVSTPDPMVWSPFGDQTHPRLNTFFKYSTLRSTNEAAAHLFDVLFSDREKETELSEGFRGHPSLGAAALANTVELSGVEPWASLRNRIGRDGKSGNEAVVFLFGSVFGGTGAAGVPTIGRLLKNELTGLKARIGCALMLPYFSFPRVDDDQLRADAENFLLNTQAALKYYSTQDYLQVFDTAYLIGDDSLTNLGPQPGDGVDPKGGKDQRNQPHFAELYAALAALDFYEESLPAHCAVIARQSPSKISWGDLPYRSGTRDLKMRLETAIRFAFAHLRIIEPVLDEIRRSGKEYRVPWYQTFFAREGMPLDEAAVGRIQAVSRYSRTYLEWIASVQSSAKRVSLELVNTGPFADSVASTRAREVTIREPGEMLANQFANLTLPLQEEQPRALSDLWARLSDSRAAGRQARGIAGVFEALYEECATRP
jgi:hypothetical protein